MHKHINKLVPGDVVYHPCSCKKHGLAHAWTVVKVQKADILIAGKKMHYALKIPSNSGCGSYAFNYWTQEQFNLIQTYRPASFQEATKLLRGNTGKQE